MATYGSLCLLSRSLVQSVVCCNTQRVTVAKIASFRRMLSHSTDNPTRKETTFDVKMLDHLVCPLSKKQLRYDERLNELVCDDLGVAYPIMDGIPNLVPQDARMLKNETGETVKS